MNNLYKIIGEKFDMLIAEHNDLDRLKKFVSAFKGYELQLSLNADNNIYHKKISELGNPFKVKKACYMGRSVIIENHLGKKIAFSSVGVKVRKTPQGLEVVCPSDENIGLHLTIIISEETNRDKVS